MGKKRLLHLTKNIYMDFSKYRKLGKGSFGTVYKAMWDSNQVPVAIKHSKKKCKQFLASEFEILNMLKDQTGVPKVYQLLHVKDDSCIMMELLGRSLITEMCDLSRVGQIGAELTLILKTIHDAGIIHRDIKPENILRALTDDRLYLVDFGVAKRIISNGIHDPFSDNHSFVGTPRYASLSAHKGHAQGRKDDFESLMYTLLVLLNGRLPWQGLPKKELKIQQIKEEFDIKQVSQGSEAIEKVFNYIKTLQFDSRPDYEFIINQFESMQSKKRKLDLEIEN